MAKIAEDDTFTQVVRFDVPADKQLALIEAIAGEVERWVRHRPGFISSSFHASFDEEHVVNYAQWALASFHRVCVVPICLAVRRALLNCSVGIYRMEFVAASSSGGKRAASHSSVVWSSGLLGEGVYVRSTVYPHLLVTALPRFSAPVAEFDCVPRSLWPRARFLSGILVRKLSVVCPGIVRTLSGSNSLRISAAEILRGRRESLSSIGIPLSGRMMRRPFSIETSSPRFTRISRR